MVRALRAAAEKERGSGGQPGSSERRAIQAEDSEQSPRGRTPGPSEGQERVPVRGAQEARVGEVRQRGGPDHLPLHSPRVGAPAAQRLTSTLKGSLSRREQTAWQERRGESCWEATAIDPSKRRRWLGRRGREQWSGSRYVHSEGRAKRMCGQDDRSRREKRNLGRL